MHKSVVLAPALLFALAACGSGGSSSGSSSSSSGGNAGNAGASSNATLSVRTTSLGKVLVDNQGRTVYMLTSDKNGTSSCNASCLQYWPMVKAPAPVPSHLAGVSGTLGSTASMSGGKILTINGHPLYTYSLDSKPGDVTGQGVKSFGGAWWVLSASGKPVTGSSSSGSSGGGYSSGGGGGGY
ncbi:MAG: COG4315 family predicted lipoprotein [Nocardioidaceae bacterium]